MLHRDTRQKGETAGLEDGRGSERGARERARELPVTRRLRFKLRRGTVQNVRWLHEVPVKTSAQFVSGWPEIAKGCKMGARISQVARPLQDSSAMIAALATVNEIRLGF